VETLTWVIELGVGVACLVIGIAAFRTGRLRIVGVVLVVAGVAAAAHGLISLWAIDQ
jgi:hypothetical protein